MTSLQKRFAVCGLIFIPFLINAQSSIHQHFDVKKWYQEDVSTDSVYGISLNKAYNFLKGKKSTPVIVGVIDSGVDTTHEDLKKILWTNPKEIPGNGIDDDNNGYIDDVHGWNFLGNKNGENINKENDERTRVYYRYKSQFDGKTINEDSLSADDKWIYAEWKKASAEMTPNSDEQMEVMMLDVLNKTLKKHDEVLRQEIGKEEYSQDDLEKFEPSDAKGKQAKNGFLTSLKMIQADSDVTNKSIIAELDEYIDGKKRSLESKTTAPQDYRALIIKDNPDNINDKHYGNNNIMGPDPDHGTHVTGIIAAQRNNGIGIDGIANNVQVMMLRAVPDGDENDKDVALAIFYAVDNGAKVINMSFGKGFSPGKKWVDSAVAYAEAHDVLLVHAAGNESHDIDTVDNFPSPVMLADSTKANNFVTVGASGDAHLTDGKMIAYFSNYGNGTVDVFAPGVKIYSSLPGGNIYGYHDGTSMASPVVAGIAALVRSYYPQLTADQVKEVIAKSVTHLNNDAMVNKPGYDSKEMVPFSTLASSAGVVNAFGAVKYAASMQPEKPKSLIKGNIQNNKSN